MSSFSKNEDCPPSPRLLAYQIGEIESIEERAIFAHLSSCDFCSAEVDLYSCFPPEDEKVVMSQMPQPLFELATALMGGTKAWTSSKGSHEIDGLYDDGFKF